MFNKLSILLIFFVIIPLTVPAVELVFTFANGSVTGSSPKTYEFDVMISANETGTLLGDTQIYINYSADGFGEKVVENGVAVVTKGAMLAGDYHIINTIDNTNSKFVVTVNYTDNSGTASSVATTPTQLLHVQMQVADDSKSAGLTFGETLMAGQQYYSDDAAKYSQVTGGNSDDSKFTPIEIDLVSFAATPGDGHVLLEWETGSETNHAGFNIFRSTDNENHYEKINENLIPAASKNLNGAHYSYKDQPANPALYYYKLQSISLAGGASFHPSVSVKFTTLVDDKSRLPNTFKLGQNYPNPFNPETQISYQLPSEEFVDLAIYNMHGQLVKNLVRGTKSPGRYTVLWDGQDEKKNSVGSGVYILSIKAGDFSENKRLTLLR